MKWQIPQISRGKIIALLILVIVAGAAVGYGILKIKNDTVASLNGERITKSELYDAMVKSSGQQTLDALISQKIVEMEAARQKVVVSEAEINKEMARLYETYGGEDAFLQNLAMSGYSLADVRQDTISSLKIKKLLEPKITITEKEMQSYFAENKATFAQSKQVRASHILVDSEAKAKEVKQKLDSGGDFAKLAKEYSIDTGTKDNGGDLGFFGSGEMTPEFEEAAFALKAGQVSEPLKTEYGYHIIKVTEIKDAQEANYEKSQTKVKEAILEQKVSEEYAGWMQGLYKKYKVDSAL